MTVPVVDPVDRQYVSRYHGLTLGVQVYVSGELGNADDNQVTVRIVNDANDNTVSSREADHVGPGSYATTLTSEDTAVPGRYSVVFEYSVNGNAATSVIPFEVGQAAPVYDALTPSAQQVVENVYAKFADLYDSPFGGPHLQVYLASKFGRNRMAQLLQSALGKVNLSGQPVQSYSFDPAGNQFPFNDWGPFLEQALYIEVIKHLIRTYTEQPEIILGTSVSRTDRRDYTSRWQEVLRMETDDFKDMAGNFRMAHMFLGRPSVLVSGGAYGRWGPNVGLPGGLGEAAARGYFIGRHF